MITNLNSNVDTQLTITTEAESQTGLSSSHRPGFCATWPTTTLVAHPFGSRVECTSPDDPFGSLAHEELLQRIADSLLLFLSPGCILELRALHVIEAHNRKPHIVSGFFDADHLHEMARHAIDLSQSAKGVYFTLNPINRDLLARRCNRVGEASNDLSMDKDVVKRRWLLIDVDPQRVAGVSATDVEKNKAQTKVLVIQEYLRDQEWPDPIVADSGNGYHLLYAIDLPTEDEGLVKRVLHGLADQFDDEAVKVDRSVFNPARIVKLYGTQARKGDHTPDRPHRWTGIRQQPDKLEVVSLDRLKTIAGLAKPVMPKEELAKPASTSNHPVAASGSVVERARSYLTKLPPAISGQHGHDRTFQAACILRRGFALSAEQAMPLLKDWNEKCQPPWSPADLEHKLEDAGNQPGSIGYLLPPDNNRPQKISSFRARFLDSAALDNDTEQLRWLVKQVLAANQPAVVGGPKKSLKTSIVLDLAISLGTGTPFLGKFDVPSPASVLVLSGESGKATLRDTARRICKVRQVDFRSCGVKWGFDLPKLSNSLDLVELTGGLLENGIQVVIIDPLYLCLAAGSEGLQTSNLFEVGPLLLNVAQACLAAGATPILVHHARKANQMVKGTRNEPLDLEDLAYAGIAEFARQWLLISRRAKYDPGLGEHQLWLNVGGSAGHSGLYGLNVLEGKMNDQFGGRDWFVNVLSPDEALKEVKKAQQDKKREEDHKKEADEKERVIDALRLFPDGETQTAIAEAAGIPRKRIGDVLKALLNELVVCKVCMTKGFGTTSKKVHLGWKLYHEPGKGYFNNPQLDALILRGIPLQQAEAELEERRPVQQ